jgi:hypothetical protein
MRVLANRNVCIGAGNCTLIARDVCIREPAYGYPTADVLDSRWLTAHVRTVDVVLRRSDQQLLDLAGDPEHVHGKGDAACADQRQAQLPVAVHGVDAAVRQGRKAFLMPPMASESSG